MYKRLTRRNEKKPRIVYTECVNCEYNGDGCSGWNCAMALAKRLAEYEDTGCSPAEVVALNAPAYWEQTEEAGLYKCTNCHFPDIQPEFRKRCSNCGARMQGVK